VLKKEMEVKIEKERGRRERIG
jgi:hypothetical protein